MSMIEWAGLVTAGVACLGALGGAVGWMLSVYWKLASVDCTLIALKQQLLLDAAEHSEEHRRLWHTLECHEERIRMVERTPR